MHEEHRNRLRDKAINNISSLNDFELLELILFSAKPRVNTNDTAHLLLNTFGDLKGVFSASPKALAEVSGVGKNTASFICALGQVITKINLEQDKPQQKVFSLLNIKDQLLEIFKGQSTEVFITYYIDKNQQIIGKRIIGDHLTDRVDIDLSEFTKQLVYNKPRYVVIAHNHLSGDPHPSQTDMATTERICFLLKVNNIKLLDHIIVANDQIYSFFHEYKLQEIEQKLSTIS